MALGVLAWNHALVRRVAARTREIERLTAFPRYNPNPVLELDPAGGVVFANDAAAALAGELGAAGPAALLPAKAAAEAAACLADGKPRSPVAVEVGGRTLHWSFFPVPGGTVHAYAADVTEQLRLEAEVFRKNRLEAVGLLAAGVSHDFNNLIQIVLGHAILARETADPGQRRESLDEVVAAADRAVRLTSQLRAFARRQPVAPAELNLNAVVGDTLDLLRGTLGRATALAFVPGDPAPVVVADRGQVEQVVMNLCLNARDAMPRGGAVEVAVGSAVGDAVPGGRPGRFAVLRVRDAGVGMDEATRIKMFEPFFTTKGPRATGLGLAVIDGVVQGHGGFVAVTSEVGRGTTVEVYLPAKPEPTPSPRRGTPVAAAV